MGRIVDGTGRGALTSSARRIHDPGARRVLLLIVGAAPRLRRHARALTAATHATPGVKPKLGGPKADAKRLLQAIAGLHSDLHALRSNIKHVDCRTTAGRRGKADILKSLKTLDEELTTFSTAVTSQDSHVKGTATQRAMRLNKQAQAAAQAGLALLQR